MTDCPARFFKESDGVLMCTSNLYEHNCLESWRKWFGAKPVLNVGALSPQASDLEVIKAKESPAGGEVEKFLDDMMDKHGPNSVVYVSMIHLRNRGWKVDTFLKDILRNGILASGASKDLGGSRRTYGRRHSSGKFSPPLICSCQSVNAL